MPKLNQEMREYVASAGVQAEQVLKVSFVFREKLQEYLARFGEEYGVSWRDKDTVDSPGFVLDSACGNIVADFDHVQRAGEILGMYRFYRYGGTPLKRELINFWGVTFSASGNASWSPEGTWEWRLDNDSDVVAFIPRVMLEFYSAIEVG
ncbi:hypothetical protein ACS0Y6_06730 [Burkholderia gladioli]|uniref:hypothetical protein n=1 Tax=Burkholderia gladioli TaxID=28095 RepID=UPI003F7941B0